MNIAPAELRDRFEYDAARVEQRERRRASRALDGHSRQWLVAASVDRENIVNLAKTGIRLLITLS